MDVKGIDLQAAGDGKVTMRIVSPSGRVRLDLTARQAIDLEDALGMLNTGEVVGVGVK